MTAPTPQRADAHRNREAVVAAAIELLSAQPDASMKDVAEASGLGRTTVYRHFPSREALIRALYEEVFVDAEAAVRAIVAAHRAPRDVFPRLAQETIAIGVRYQFLAAHQDLIAEIQCQPREDPLRDWIDAGLAAGELRPLGSTWIQSMITALVTAAHAEVREGRESKDDAVRKLGDAMIAAFAT